jgi:hypothetical protein
MKPRLSIVYFIAALFALPVLGVFAEQPATLSVELLSTFDYPGDVLSTQPQKINDQSVVVGVIADFNGVRSGFLRLRKGFFSDPLVDPNDTGNSTEGRGINNDLLVCGDYLDGGTGNFHGFFLQGAAFHDFDVPGSSWTIVLGVNNAGDFSGSDIPSSGVQSGFVSIGGVITEFTVPGASNTLAYQINGHNVACGYYIDSGGITHGYYRDSDGSIFSPIDPAGSTGTIVFGNNDKNWIVGRYADAAGLTHGFVFVPPDQYVTYDFPGSTFTSLNGINKRGLIVGRYLDPSSGIEHGILVRVTNGASDRSTTGVIPQRQTSQATASQPATFKAVEPAL